MYSVCSYQTVMFHIVMQFLKHKFLHNYCYIFVTISPSCVAWTPAKHATIIMFKLWKPDFSYGTTNIHTIIIDWYSHGFKSAHLSLYWKSNLVCKYMYRLNIRADFNKLNSWCMKSTKMSDITPSTMIPYFTMKE